MATLDLTEYDPVLKEHYSDEYVRGLAYTDNVLVGLFRKKSFTGDDVVQAIDYSKPGNASASFTTAQANSTNGAWKKFTMSTASQYLPVSIAPRVIMASKTDMGAFAPALQLIDNAHMSLAEKVNRHLYRTSTGSIGRFSASGTNVGTAVGTLTDKADAWNFEPGDVIVLDDTDGGGVVKSGTLTVESVDPEAGTVTFTGNISAGVATAANTDYLFHAGDYDACAVGLESWMPTGAGRAAALAASFFGTTRSAYGERLGGVYLDATTASFGDLNEVITMLMSRVTARKGKPNVYVMHNDRFAQLQLLWLSKQVQFDNISVNITESVGGRMVTFGVAYPGMKAMVGGRIVTILSDRCCPTNKIYALQTNTWTLWHYGSAIPCFPRKEIGSGEGILREKDTADAYEARVAAYYQLGCSAPGWNGVALLPSL